MSDLCRRMCDCSRKVVTLALHKLHDDKLVNKNVTGERMPRVEYELTETGKTLMPYIENMVQWAKLNYPLTDNLYTD